MRAPRPPREHTPSVLLCREKHATRVWDATTEEALHASALAILDERMKSGWHYYDPEKEKPPVLQMPEAQILALPFGRVRDTAMVELDRYKRDVQDRQRAIEEYADIQKALAEKNGKLAWRILRDRSDAEYERVELVDLERAS